MKQHSILWLAVLGMILSCQKERVLKAGPDAPHERQAEYEAEAPVDESVNVPAPITGAYLVCAKLSSEASLQQKVGCRVEADGGAVPNFKTRAEKITWTHEAQGSTIDIKLLEEENNQGWLATFMLQADAAAIQSKVMFQAAYVFDGLASNVKTDLVLLWNEDCALPPIQFESLGEKSGAGVVVADQFRQSHGIRFSTLSGAPLLLAAYNQANANPLGYLGGGTGINNYLIANQNGGKFFVTDRYRASDTTETLVMEYDRPVKEAALELVDVDLSETYVIRAFNAQGGIVDEVQVQAAVVGGRDGQLSRFVVRSPDGSNVITRLQVYGFIPAGTSGIGFGIDNIAPRCGK